MRKAIVSVLLGNYDKPKHAPRFSGWACYLFTDRDIDSSLGWKVIKVNTKNPLKDSRYYKWMTHKTLPNYDLVCYIDASMLLKKAPPEDELWFKHPTRTNVHDEGKRILLYYPKLRDIIDVQLDYYKKKGFNDDYGLFQNGFFIRWNNAETNKLCEIVYEVVQSFCHRDQLALPYALFLTNYKMQGVLEGHKSNKWIEIHRHL